MALKLMYITNQLEIAKIAEANGVDWIFIDLERIGKTERQGHLDTVMSQHEIKDIRKIKEAIIKSKILVRSNPIHEGSKEELDQIISNGADIVMLPYFKTLEEVQYFLDCVGNRAETCLLFETPEAVEIVDSILELKGIDYIHIGLNDLHLGYGMKFMFELLADGTVEKLGDKFKKKGISFGFGGIAQLGQGALPAEMVIAEHYRLGSNMAILSRSFCDSDKFDCINEINNVFKRSLKDVRELELDLMKKEKNWFSNNKAEVETIVEDIKQKIANR